MSVSYESLNSLVVRSPGPGERVYKDECAYSFTNPESEDGLYVSLFSFLGLSKQHALDYAAKTGFKAFLHIKRLNFKIEGSKEEKAPTKLAIGLEGGFQDTPKTVRTEENVQIVILPEGAVFNVDDPKLPEGLRSSAEGVSKAESAFHVVELESTSGTWDGEARQVSIHSEKLQQLNNGVKIPLSGWKCSRCELSDNLWLNLTDGSINCGRAFFDGTGGNNHALQHYNETKFPLVVKLGTITHNTADVFSYTEDDMVVDTELYNHLLHFGIDMDGMQKTEKSMAELELDMNQRVGEWATCTEEGCKLEPLYGPGYTGLVNLGNSCYMNSVIQMIFTIPEFIQTYFHEYSNIIQNCADDPNINLRVQMAKLAHGILSGSYSKKPASDLEIAAIKPQSFKNVVGKNHPEFSSKRQQDAEEYFCHLLDMLNKNDRNHPVSKAFSFTVEDRIQCGKTKKVTYKRRTDTVLRLNVPMDSATNKAEVEVFQTKKKIAEQNKERIDPKETVLAKIPFEACLSSFAATEFISDFFSSACKEKVTAEKSSRFLTFPDYLLVQVKKFTLAPNCTPIKLDISLQVPEDLDISSLRSKGGLQPGEEEMPSDCPQIAPINEEFVKQLVEMGFAREGCKKAVFHTKDRGVEAALQWVMEHMGDADFDMPFVPPGSHANISDVEISEDNERTVMGMGFTRSQAIKALKATRNNVDRAIDWIFSHTDELDAPDEVASEQTDNTSPDTRDGQGKYKLSAFITHMGPNTSSGHYVCHLLKEGRWVICNDEKIAVSEKPPKDLGYLYLYKRV